MHSIKMSNLKTEGGCNLLLHKHRFSILGDPRKKADPKFMSLDILIFLVLLIW